MLVNISTAAINKLSFEPVSAATPQTHHSSIMPSVCASGAASDIQLQDQLLPRRRRVAFASSTTAACDDDDDDVDVEYGVGDNAISVATELRLRELKQEFTGLKSSPCPP
jgi:hypothetical protein